jgi:hypothetical protein
MAFQFLIFNLERHQRDIYNNNKASNAKIGQNINKAVYFFACFFHVNLVVCFDSILPKYTSALLFRKSQGLTFRLGGPSHKQPNFPLPLIQPCPGQTIIVFMHSAFIFSMAYVLEHDGVSLISIISM